MRDASGRFLFQDKTQQLHLRTTENEMRMLREVAKLANSSMTDYVMFAIRSRIDTDRQALREGIYGSPSSTCESGVLTKLGF